MLNSNLSKPVQLTRKSLITSRNSNRKDFNFEENKELKSPLKRRPSLDEVDTKQKSDFKNGNKVESNLAARPEPISKALIEEARARRASKSAIKQVSSSPKTKISKKSPQKKSPKQRPLEKDEKKIDLVKKNTNKKETNVVEKIIIKNEESEQLLSEIKTLKEQQKSYRIEIEQLKTENKVNLQKINLLEKQKEEHDRNRRDIESSKKLLESEHQRNIEKVQKLLKVCRRDLNAGNETNSSDRWERRLDSKPKLDSRNRKKKENDLNIINLLLCDNSYEQIYLDQLIMIEESNGNVWGLSSRDLNELNSIINIYDSNRVDKNYIKTQINTLSWFLDISFQRNSSIPYISHVLDKMGSNQINFQEFLTFLFVPIFSSSHYSYLDQLFDLFDMDNDSFISLEDMKGVIKEIEWEDVFSSNDLRYLLKQMSTNVFNKNIGSEGNHDILISKEEFNEFFRSIFD